MEFQLDLCRLQTRPQLVDFLGIPETEFEAILAFAPPATSANEAPSGLVQKLNIPLFIRHNIPKKNKARGHRTVWEPTFHKRYYKALARRLDLFFQRRLAGYPHSCVYGYRVGRNIRENAKEHSGHALLLTLDIANFFPSISAIRVGTLFQNLGVSRLIADLLSRFLTINGALPLGLPTSPVISNAITLPIDIELQKLTERVGITYTRYADDLTFSSNDTLPDVNDIRKCLAANGFDVAEAKTRRSRVGQAHYVTGLSTSDPVQPHVPRKKKHALRQELFYARKFGLENHLHHRGINDIAVVQQELNRIDGLVKFVAHHEPRLATMLKTQWAEIVRESGMKPSFAPKNQARSPFYIFIDEAEFKRSDTKILALGMAVSQHAVQIVAESQEVLAATLADLWAAGDIAEIKKKGLHFADATEDLRLAYVKRLASMPFEGYVAFVPFEGSADYEATYIRLLSALISRRLMAAESKLAAIYIEGNSKVAPQAVTACIQRAFDDLKSRNDRRPEAISVEFVSKPNLGISVPDFLLGALGKYLHSKPAREGKPLPRDRLMFERLRDKYSLILDVTTWTEYSRRRPIEPWF